MAETLPQQSAKPGTACLGCRRRKLKCSREPEGCSNCLKPGLPCVYPAPEPGSKRRRGPYKKDKPPRERHLEDLVKYLEPKVSQSESSVRNGSWEAPSGAEQHSGYDEDSPMKFPDHRSDAPTASDIGNGAARKTNNSEELVKDALFALTRSSVVEKDVTSENDAPEPASQLNESGGIGIHPSVKRIFEYWHLFSHRVDPLTKVIHGPSFEKVLLRAVANLQNVEKSTETLMFSVYYAAVSTCTPRETRRRFGESQEVLLRRYGRNIEAALSENYSIPVLESLQALVIYITVIQREDALANLRALFSLAVRMAQLIGLQEDPGEAFLPYEAEMRRRLWWHICSLESRGCEEGGARSTSIMENRHVNLPANLLDHDLHPSCEQRPQPRVGITHMTFILMRFETLRMVHKLWLIRKRQGQDGSTGDLKSVQRKSLSESKLRLDTLYLQYLHESRAYDWLCIKFIETMLIKARLIIEHPFGQVPTKQMSNRDRFDLLQASVDIIRLTNSLATHKMVEKWMWYFRGWNQWHSLAIVIAELGWTKNQQFANGAWAVLDPILANWDKVYKAKRDEPAWDHVNALIERARQMRQQNLLRSEHSPGNQAHVGKKPSATNQLVVPTNGRIAISSQPDSSYHHFNDIVPAAEPFHPHNWDIQPQVTPPATSDTPFLTGCAPAMVGFEGDFGSFDGLEDIDFSAFDAVFGGIYFDWNSSSTPGTDWGAMDNATMDVF